MEYLLKASAVICIFYLCFLLLLKRETFFNHNRWFLITGLVIALVFPFIVIPIYVPIEPISTSQLAFIVNEGSINNITTVQTQQNFEWISLLPIIYGIGFSLLFIQFLFQFGSLIWLLLKNPKNKHGIYTYVIVKNKISPFSFFKWIVFNPEEYNNDELQLILMHEKVHVNQLHSLDILFTQLSCVIFWFNPLMWLYKKEVSQNLEYIADSKTQSISKNEKTYQRLLLKTSAANHNMALSNNLYNSQIKKRIIMLHKSRSNSKKQWRYLLILPLLAGLLMSMNTETIYVDNSTKNLSSKETIEFIVTKNTTDIELKEMSEALKNKGGALVFKDIKRNSADEITNIFVKLNNHSYGGGDSKSGIEEFIIYKEFFGDKGGYVGRPQAATMHFDNNKKHEEKLYKELEKRATVKMQQLGLKNMNNVYIVEKPNKEHVKVKHTSTNNPNKPKIIGDISMTIINKNTSDAELDKIKETLKKEGVTVKFKGIKRNKKGEIRAIKIEAKSKKSSTSYQVNSDDETIDPIKIVFDKENNTILIRNSHTTNDNNAYIFETHNGGKHKIHKSGKGNNVFVISEEHEYDEEHEHDGEHEHESHIIIKEKGAKGKLKTIKKTKNIEVISEGDEVIEVIVESDGNNEDEVIIVNGKNLKTIDKDVEVIIEEKNNKKVWVNKEGNNEDIIAIQNDNNNNNIYISTDSEKDPLFIVDGKEISKEKFKDLNVKNIESVNVLKDKSAIEKYGDKGKNGVIIITTKKN
jgi:TonB-dependent SusC/RagA subfamily outer membrane receptor